MVSVARVLAGQDQQAIVQQASAQPRPVWNYVVRSHVLSYTQATQPPPPAQATLGSVY
jgi:hypothetical protein